MIEDNKTETVVKKEFPDSIELGSPSKGGVVKVYFDASKPDEAKTRVDNAIAALNYALTQKNSVEVSKNE